MRSIDDPLFQKNIIYNADAITAGGESTMHEATWDKKTGHYICDDTKDAADEQ